jgi:ABC-2 type transport system ATP-binding protein
MIEVKNLTKFYGNKKAVDDVSFAVNKGDVLGFLGPNGAGKSTTMKMVTGFLKPTAGTATIGGFDIQKEARKAKQLFGYLPENGPLYEEMTVREFLEFIAGLRMEQSKVKDSIARVTEMCHVQEVLAQPIETLSKGYRQRVGMAQALIHDPSVLIMDEPTDGLDPNQKHGVRNLISSMARDKAIILSTHILEEVDAMCTRLIVIAKGTILADEKPLEFRKRHPHFGGVKVTAKNSEEAAKMKETFSTPNEVAKVTQDGASLIILPKSKSSLNSLVLRVIKEKNLEVSSVTSLSTPLDHVFKQLTNN